MDLFWVLVAIALITTYSKHVDSDESIYVSQLTKCLKSIESIPSNISSVFDINSKNNHIELVVHNNGKFDYYKMNWKGYCCYKSTGLEEIPLRTEAKQDECDNYDIGEKMDFYNFRCAYEIIDDKSYSILAIHPTEGNDEADIYFVNKGTGNIEYRYYEQFYSHLHLYVPHDQSDDTTTFLLQLDECLNKRDLIPKNLPISIDVTKRNRHIEIIVFYENQYDYYKINWNGIYCYRTLAIHQLPNRTIDEHVVQCDNRPLSSSYDYGNFHCAFDTWTTTYEDDDYFIFFVSQNVNSTSGSNAYIINKSRSEVAFYDFQDKFSGDTIFERYKEVDTSIAIKECAKKEFELPRNVSIKFEMLAKYRQIEIIFSYDNKFDYYELNWINNVRIFRARLEEIPKKELEDLTEDEDLEFKCPYSVIDDKDYSIIVIQNISNVQDNLPEAYVYFINKDTFEVIFKFYPSFYRCKLEVPQTKNDNNPEFDSEIESCVNRKNLLPSALNAYINITRITNHIEIIMSFDGKYDYYEINYNGLTCYTVQGLSEPIKRNTIEAVQQCENRRITSCGSTRHSFNCGFEILNPQTDHYIALVIRSAFDDPYATFSYSGSYVYLMDKLTNKVDLMPYSLYSEDAILVEQTEADKSSVYIAEFNECLNLKNSLPNDFPIEFNVTKVNHHTNILVYDNGHYDYYEHNVRGEACFTAVRMKTNPTRTVKEQMKCDARRLKGSLKPYTEEYQPQFRCGFEVIKNETFIVVFVHSTDGVYEYNVNRTTGKTELYLYQIFNEPLLEQENKCVKRKHLSDFNIPLEVTKKPKNIDKDEHYLEILVKYQGKYDLYVTEESGYVRYTEMQLKEKPNLTLSDYSNKIQCQQNTNFRVFNMKTFRCPLQVVENEQYVNISVNAFHYENVYIIDKVSNDITYFKVKDNLILSNLPIPDAELNYIADMDECVEKLTNLRGPFPLKIIRNKDFLEIVVKFNGTLSIYETTTSGREMCKISRESSWDSIEFKLLKDVHPECVSCDGPAFTFTCPKVTIEEDENKVSLEITHGPGSTTHLYSMLKSSGELTYDITAALGPAIAHTLKSLIG